MCVFPAELVFKILYNSDPPDIVRWQTVSHWFRAIADDDVLWKALYTDSSFPRPPGPSPSQSSAFLGRMLVKSAQLAQSWTTRPMREISSVNIKLGRPSATTPIKLISGRWLVGCEYARRFVLHDADPRAKTHARKVLWEQEGPVVSAWDVHSVSPLEGQSVVYVLLEPPKTEPALLEWKLLEFRLNDGSGEIYGSATIDPPAWARSALSRVELHGGKSRFLFIPTENPKGVVFDTRTRGFYAVPRLRVALAETFPENLRDSPPLDFRMEFTDTHIISLYYHHDWLYGILTLIQIFTVLSDASSVQGGNPVLRLTHEGFSDGRLLNVGIMKPRVDPITGATSMRLLDYCDSRKELEIACIDLVLPKPSGLEVSPMAVDDMHKISIPKEGVKTSRYLQCCQYLDVSDDKQLRGFYRGETKHKLFDPIENQHIMKFAIDTRRDPWAITCGQISPAEWSDAADPKADVTGKSITFDGLRGRLCYVDPKVKDQVVVVEIE